MHTHKIIDGERVALSKEEIAELNNLAATFVPPEAPQTLTKEQLLAQLQELTARINALE